jgi:serine hydrolase
VTKHVLFIQGTGQGAHEEDKALVESLMAALGPEYVVHYPVMPNDGDAPYTQWKQHIESALASIPGPVILVGHSVGASVLMKRVSESKVEQPIAGMFLLATPFWGGDGWLYEGYEDLALPHGFAARLPQGVSIFLYHCRDDATVPFAHLALYAHVLPRATVRARAAGGHQLNNDLSEVAQDIKTLPA